jgi:hypothetical protein
MHSCDGALEPEVGKAACARLARSRMTREVRRAMINDTLRHTPRHEKDSMQREFMDVLLG